LAKRKEESSEQPEAVEPSAEEPAAEQPGEPAGEQPAAEPSAEQPAAEPSAEQPTAEPSAEQPAPEPAAGEQPTAEPSAEQPVAEPAAAEPKPEPAGEQTAEPSEEQPATAEAEPAEAGEAEPERPAETRRRRPEPAADEREAEPAPLELAADARYSATGKRKSSVARVVLRPGNGAFNLNGRPLDGYFPRRTLQEIVRQPLKVTGYVERVDITAKIHGGGISSQADALRHGIAKALIEAQPSLRGELKRKQLLTRDPRVKERRKAGLKKARKRPQFSKR
jgi:small subunit ribosomal protein S9